MLLSTTVDAEHKVFHRAEGVDWSQGEINLEIVWQALNYVDYLQTKRIFRDDRYTEKNPLVSHPKDVLWFGLVHYLLTEYVFTKEKERVFWQSVSIGVKSGVVYNNYFIGIRF